MAEKVILPEEEIVETYKTNTWYTIGRLAKKYKTTDYQIRKVLAKHNAVRQTSNLEIELIKRFLKYEAQHDVRIYGRERGIARQLIAKYPNEEFWKTFTLGFELNSLAFLLSDKGADTLQKKFGAFKFEIPELQTHNIGLEKVGEDVEIVSKPLSLHDFLKKK